MRSLNEMDIHLRRPDDPTICFLSQMLQSLTVSPSGRGRVSLYEIDHYYCPGGGKIKLQCRAASCSGCPFHEMHTEKTVASIQGDEIPNKNINNL